MPFGSPKTIVNGGGLVSDDLTCALVKERLSRKDCENGYLLDGFPRTIAQAEALKTFGKEINREVNTILNISCPDELLIERIAGRRVCPKCGASYNVTFMPPKKQEGICDECGTPIVQRKDDNAESFKVRLANYYKSTAPLMEFYKGEGLLTDFDGSIGAADLKKALVAFLEEHK